MTEDEINRLKANQAQAAEELYHIRRLTELDSFQTYYAPRIQREIDEQKQRVLYGNYDGAELKSQQRILAAMEKLRDIPKSDAAECLKLIETKAPSEYRAPDHTHKRTHSV